MLVAPTSVFFDDACKLKRQVEDNIEIQSSIVETINTEEQQYGPIQPNESKT